MNGMERYIGQVLENVFAAEEDKERFEKDLRTHFADGLAAGETEAEIIRRMGSPDDVAASFMENVQPHYAGFWIRSLAFITDIGLMALLVLPLFCLVFLARFGDREAEQVSLAFLILMTPIVLWALALSLFYFPVLERHFGKTLGKHLLKLRVLTETRTRISLGQAFLRRLSAYFEFLMLDALFVPFTAKRQRAFDIVAKTVVVRESTDVGVGWLFCGLLVAAPVLVLLVLVFLGLAEASVG